MSTSSEDDLDLVRRRVINVVGHELRTPLTTLRGLVDLLPDASEDVMRDQLIPALVRTAARAEHLLDDLLLAAGVSTVEPVDPAAPVDLDALVAATASRFEMPVAGRADVFVTARDRAVARALEHLVENAKVHGDGPSEIRVLVEDDHVVVDIRTPVEREVDNLELAFEVFWRGEEAVTRAAGMGIGLPVARALARLDGGDVTVSQNGNTVTATLRLPRAR